MRSALPLGDPPLWMNRGCAVPKPEVPGPVKFLFPRTGTARPDFEKVALTSPDAEALDVVVRPARTNVVAINKVVASRAVGAFIVGSPTWLMVGERPDLRTKKSQLAAHDPAALAKHARRCAPPGALQPLVRDHVRLGTEPTVSPVEHQVARRTVRKPAAGAILPRRSGPASCIATAGVEDLVDSLLAHAPVDLLVLSFSYTAVPPGFCSGRHRDHDAGGDNCGDSRRANERTSNSPFKSAQDRCESGSPSGNWKGQPPAERWPYCVTVRTMLRR